MQLFSAAAIVFDPKKVKKRASKVAHNRPRPLYFTVQPRPTANSQELILHIKKSRDQTSVLLSVSCWLPNCQYCDKINFYEGILRALLQLLYHPI